MTPVGVFDGREKMSTTNRLKTLDECKMMIWLSSCNTLNFGETYPDKLVVIEDGHNLMPEEPQNFKYISWMDLAEMIFTD